MIDNDMVELANTNYYMIVNKASRQALYLNHESTNI